LAEIEYPDAMQVRTVKSHGHFRWKRHDVFLSEVLWGEPVGLLPFDDGCHTVYFAHMPVALFDERTRKTHRLPTGKGMKTRRSVSGAAAPETEKQNLPDKGKVSGMCPV
jgi:hypothetical protein